MGNLLSSLLTVADSMEVFQRALSVSQNNVTNASTPGFVRQRLSLEPKPFNLDLRLPGGVAAGSLISSREEYLEEGVRLQTQRLGRNSQQVADLAQVEPVFDITQNAGIAGAMDRLFQSFSQLSVTPNDTPTRQTVINRAVEVANAFNYTSAALSRVSGNGDRELRNTVDAINRVATRLRDFNTEIRRDYRNASNPGLDAQIHSTLEELSELVDFTVLRQKDGTMSLYVGGQTPLLVGDRLFPLQANLSGSSAQILSSGGVDITSHIQQGSLRALLDLRNTVVPTLLGDLNLLAQTLADRINTTLAGGLDASGQPPAVNLFAYNTAADAARTLRVTAITENQIAAALPAGPGGNGNALALAALATTPQVAGNFTFTEYYGRIAGSAGRQLANARDEQRTQELLLSQAKSLRGEISSVSLDEEAAMVIQFQRAYEASARLVSVLNDMTDEVLDFLR